MKLYKLAEDHRFSLISTVNTKSDLKFLCEHRIMQDFPFDKLDFIFEWHWRTAGSSLIVVIINEKGDVVPKNKQYYFYRMDER